jgi:short-subunit dehydrogenase
MKVFITGGTTGIGLELARQYLADGHVVGVCGRDLTKLPQELKDKLKSYQLSVTDKKSLDEAISDFGRDGLDIVIANAGRSVGVKEKMADWSKAYDVMDTNVYGVMYAFESALKIMTSQKSGHLVAISSVAGFVGLAGAASYSASKAAVTTFCESISLDYKSDNINVTCICPGFIDTPLTKQNNHPMPFLMSASKGAALIRAAIERKKLRYIFPWQMNFLMMFLRILPRKVYYFIMSNQTLNFTKS